MSIHDDIRNHVAKGSHQVIGTPAPGWGSKHNRELFMCYSVGRIAKGQPELMISGVPPQIGGQLINDLALWYETNVPEYFDWKTILHPKDGKNADILQGGYPTRLFDVFDCYLKPEYQGLRHSDAPVLRKYMQEVNGWAPWVTFDYMESQETPMHKAHLLFVFLPDKSLRFCWDKGFDLEGLPSFGF